jgi:hypothetical protein
MDEWIRKCGIDALEYYLAIKNDAKSCYLQEIWRSSC